MGAGDNKELVRRWIVDGWNGDDNEQVMRDVFADDWIDGDDPAGPHGWEGIRAFVHTYRAAFPDVELDILQIAADDDFVAFRWQANGTHTGPLLGLPPTGRPVSFTGHTLHRVEAGLIKESWVQTDTVTMLKQLGVTEIPG